MKKLVAFVTTAVLAGSVFAFAGCKKDEDNGSSTTIPGNYQEATAEEVGEALGKVDFDKVLPDLSQEGAKLGFEIGSNLTANVNIPVTMAGVNGTMTIKATEDLKYNLTIDKTGYAGSGYVDGVVDINQSMSGQNMNTGYVAKLGLYNDSDYYYVNINDLKSPNEESNSGGMVDSVLIGGKVKFSIQEVIELVMDYLPDLGGSDEVAPTAAEATPDEGATENVGFAQYIAMLADYDVKVALDQSSGLKVKVSITKESLAKIVDKIDEMATAEKDAEITGYIALYKEAVTVNKFNIDLYAAFTEAGAFDKAAVDIDIDLKAKGESIMSLPQLAQAPVTIGDSTFTAKGGLYVNSYNGTVTLPEGIATDTNYQLIPLGGSGEDNKIESV